MGPRCPVEMQEAVALGTQRAASPALDDGGGGPVVVVGTQRPPVRLAAARLPPVARAVNPVIKH